MAYAVAFDVELDKLVPRDEPQSPWSLDSAPHITCAATYSDIGGSKLFYSRDSTHLPAKRMSKADAARLVDDLIMHSMRGALIISWGGTAVDFRALHAALEGDQMRQLNVIYLVKNHIDVTISSATDIGMMMGLDAASQGMNLGKKSNNISTAAPRLWSEGKQRIVLEHVKKDAQLTLKVYQAIMSNYPPHLNWKTKSGKDKTWLCNLIFDPYRNIFRLRNVFECLQIPMPPVPFTTPAGMNRDFCVNWIKNQKDELQQLQEVNYTSSVQQNQQTNGNENAASTTM